MKLADIGDVIELTVDIPERNLRAGRQGTIVHTHRDDVYEVEFTNDDGALDFLAIRAEQFIIVWRVETHQWVPLVEQAAALIVNLPDDAVQEVLDFARFLSVRRQKSSGQTIASSKVRV